MRGDPSVIFGALIISAFFWIFISDKRGEKKKGAVFDLDQNTERPWRYCDHIYQNAKERLRGDIDEIKNIEKAAKMGSINAASFIGHAYLTEENNKTFDIEKGYSFIKQAGDGGHELSDFIAFVMEMHGLGVSEKTPFKDPGGVDELGIDKALAIAGRRETSAERANELYNNLIQRKGMEKKIMEKTFHVPPNRIDDGQENILSPSKVEYYGYESDEEKTYLQMAEGYFYGRNGLFRNYGIAYKYMKAASRKGSARAHLFTGYMRYYGLGTERNYKKAVFYFEEALKRKSAEAAAFLGEIDLRNAGGPGRIKRGFSFLKASAKHGAPIGNYFLAEAIKDFEIKSSKAHGNGRLEKDLFKVFELIKNAAENENPMAMVKYSYYLKGEEEERRKVLKRLFEICYIEEIMSDAFCCYQEDRLYSALFKYIICSEMGHAVAQINAYFVLEKIEGFPGKERLQRAFLFKAADGKDKKARLLLGNVFYREGKHKEALELYEENRDDPHSLFNAAWMYRQVIGKPKNAERVEELFREAIILDGNAFYAVFLLKRAWEAEKVLLFLWIFFSFAFNLLFDCSILYFFLGERNNISRFCFFLRRYFI
eukprot:GHVN01000187.1.p1 GENE.GHVN01000187.1~~GHVN01000187.1.p1  ORF type:complete len:606 (+),score=76.77 GHVN01000187.1:29-1819(+)